MPLDHIGYYVPAAQLEAEVRFLVCALKHMDIQERMRPVPTVVGLGGQNDPFLWVAVPEGEEASSARVNLHYAVKAANREQVDEFHSAALAAGATDNGKPGIRTEYHPGYYAAFVKSPAGVNLEVVFHDMAACGANRG